MAYLRYQKRHKSNKLDPQVSILVALIIVVAVPLRHAVSPMSVLQISQSILSFGFCALGAIAIWVRPGALSGRLLPLA